MAPSIPGRRTSSRGSSSGSLRREASFGKRDAQNHQDYEDLEGQEDEESSPRSNARSKRPLRKAATKAAIVDIPLEDDDDGENDDENDDTISIDTDDVNTPATETQGDGEDNEGTVDDSGETKITKDGELLGGREFKCKTFLLPDRGSRVYMLSMDTARVLGFRDSYLFFLRNPSLSRVITTAEERQWMIKEGLLMANFKSKLIAVVSARAIFKMFGARIIKNGRNKTDDYYDSGTVEGSVADDTEEEGTVHGDEKFRSANGGPASEESRTGPGRRKRVLQADGSGQRQVTDLNWQYEGALAVRALNAQLKELRKENPKFLDPHTNIEQVPTATQPTHVHVEQVESGDFRHRQAPEGESTKPEVLSISRTIGPMVDYDVRVEVKAGPPKPPMIDDPNVWAAIPEDIRKALQRASGELAVEENEEEQESKNPKFPISVMHGQFQGSYPVHQTRFRQQFRIILPQSMGLYAQQIHQMFMTQQPRVEAPLFEQRTLLDGRLHAAPQQGQNYPPSQSNDRASTPQHQHQHQPQSQPQPQQPQHASVNPYSTRRR